MGAPRAPLLVYNVIEPSSSTLVYAMHARSRSTSSLVAQRTSIRSAVKSAHAGLASRLRCEGGDAGDAGLLHGFGRRGAALGVARDEPNKLPEMQKLEAARDASARTNQSEPKPGRNADLV